MILALPNRNWCEFQTFYIRPRSGTDSAQWDWGIREESSQTYVILQYKLLASILSAVCSVIQQS